MTVETLEQLSAAFSAWRTSKRHLREETPEELLRRARRAAERYGFTRVAQAVNVDRSQLEGTRRTGAVAQEESGSRPSKPWYSRVELLGPAASVRPFAELEMPSGVKVRLFSGEVDPVFWTTPSFASGPTST